MHALARYADYPGSTELPVEPEGLTGLRFFFVRSPLLRERRLFRRSYSYRECVEDHLLPFKRDAFPDFANLQR